MMEHQTDTLDRDQFNETEADIESSQSLLSSSDTTLADNEPKPSKHTLWQRGSSWWSQSSQEPKSYIHMSDLQEDNADEHASLMSEETVVATRKSRWITCCQKVLAWAIILLPSFLHRFIIKTPPSTAPRRGTDYLDGIRGVASLFVFFNHFLDRVNKDFRTMGFGHDPHARNFFQLPFVKLIYGGSAMVAIFFIISGYVLSHRCVKCMRQGRHQTLYTALTSMAFRRAIRLFLPSLIVTFMLYLAVCFGLVRSSIPDKDWTFWAESMHYLEYLNQDLFKLWTWEISVHGFYAHQLWTIPLEFKCSMALFVVILALSRCRAGVRISIESSLIIYLFYAGRWDVALFIVGLLLAECNIVYEEYQEKRAHDNSNLNNKPDEITNNRPWTRLAIRWALKLALWFMLILGLFICGYPMRGAAETPGYIWMATMWGGYDWDFKWRFWLSIGAVLVIMPISFLPTAQRFFTTRVARYLAFISYGLYLVHDLLDRSVRMWLWRLAWRIVNYTGGDKYIGLYREGWVMGAIAFMPIVFWCADLFTRFVDVPTVRFAKWLEGKCFNEFEFLT
jgi:peptidoglycan/LPS O-acetylase OafA/YrhL